ncbi:winged helix-turn-helix domain-containing protein [Williamsia sterculiae]|uniref:Winged helix-turn-helix domain-containing protein n=1 Tax=Williamsia sterculiae TaxID=1344003 RepID=A0A1N7ED30_9NOCA|nr:crosslink repair DNA glycosylase YcaQ family protein [Williamsia sterculiae]SIR86052.1 hypothetical protein SAMN05445060_1180 [Williamsia sterculiae]
MGPTGPTLTAAQARRTALAAQGFADPLPRGAVTRRHLSRVLDRIALLQMDSVSVAVRAHYAPLFSRLGPYDRELLDRAAWAPPTARSPRLLAEYWAHEAALIPVRDWPLFRWRMDDYQHGRYQGGRAWSAKQHALRADIHAVIAESGPVSSGQVEDLLGMAKRVRRGTWWDRSDVKHMCEIMFAAGELSAVRRSGFFRHYDLAARVVGEEIAGREVGRDDAVTALVRRALHALGVATEADIRDYYRLPVTDTKHALQALTDAAEVDRVQVRGWGQQAYADPTRTTPRRVARSALLCPFDPLIFHRPRTERLFGFHYRIEIYVPEPKRVHGYYVFPYLLNDELVARVDLKTDRAAGVLRVLGAWAEPGLLDAGVDANTAAVSLAADLRLMADWLGVERVQVVDNGDLAPALRRVISG